MESFWSSLQIFIVLPLFLPSLNESILDTPNTCSGYLDDWDSTYASRDIQCGEELLDDYGAYEYPQWFLDLCAKYDVPQDYFTVKANCA